MVQGIYRPCLNEPFDGTLGILEAGAGADDGVGHGLHGFVLADDPLLENYFETEQFFLLAFEEA